VFFTPKTGCRLSHLLLLPTTCRGSELSILQKNILHMAFEVIAVKQKNPSSGFYWLWNEFSVSETLANR